MSFIMEAEKENKLSSLDIEIICEQDLLRTIICNQSLLKTYF